jgi:hypothetical protein
VVIIAAIALVFGVALRRPTLTKPAVPRVSAPAAARPPAPAVAR